MACKTRPRHDTSRPMRCQLQQILRAWRSERQQVSARHNLACCNDTALTHPRVSSKATLRVPLSVLLQRVPKIMHPPLMSSRYHAARSNDIVIQADDSRKQNDNVNACFRKLHELIVHAGRETVPSETTPEQTKRVEQLQKAEAAGRRKMKEFQSKKKGARRGGGRGDE